MNFYAFTRRFIFLFLCVTGVLNVRSQPTALPQPDSGFDTVRERIVSDLMNVRLDTSELGRIIHTCRADGTWPGIDYADTSRTGFEHHIHLDNLLKLSRAYQQAGGRYYHSVALKEVFGRALAHWLAHDYRCANWWWNEIGTPEALGNVLLIMRQELTAHEKASLSTIVARASKTGFGYRPGGDLIKIAGIIAKRALANDDEATFSDAVTVIGSEIKITTGRGVKPDLSFHHRTDNVTSTLSYGTNYASTFAYWASRLKGTRYALPQQALKLLTDYYLDGICRFMVYGKYPDPGARNRDVSRPSEAGVASPEIPRQLLSSTDYRKDELEDLVQVRLGQKAPEISANRYFWYSTYMSHQRPEYFTSVRMYSDQNHNMEYPHNEEGLKNHYYADGSNFISRTGKEYASIFPSWDWQMIPGTTVAQTIQFPAWQDLVKEGLSNFVGGASDGTYGAATFDFISPRQTLTAHKSWFFFDKEYVCLGAGISSDSGLPIYTTVNQCLLNGYIQTSADTSWVLHDSIGYIFPEGGNVRLKAGPKTGTWQSITHQSWAANKKPVTQDIFSLWVDHGVNPADASYAYMVVPGAAPSDMMALQRTSPIRILSNTANLQAVDNPALQQAQVVFYRPGKITITGQLFVEAAEPCILMVRYQRDKITQITVTDPTKKLKRLHISIGGRQINGKGRDWEVSWDKDHLENRAEVALPDNEYAGSSMVIKF